MAVRTLGEDEIELYKSVRLRALATNPEAFGSNHVRESAFDDETWRSRLRGFAGRPGVVMVDDVDDGRVAGIVGVGQWEQPYETIIWGMWVDPAHRRRGVAQRLLAAALDWARDNSYRTVMLHVLDGNDAAHRLYVDAGFAGTERSEEGELVLRLDLLA
ncbi:MAG: GNAT family N-acetyltransferase [Acidimicrobiia bacterium]|nr:GNAT family N-acetyltransferase [Acidimicrobiia bacterium]